MTYISPFTTFISTKDAVFSEDFWLTFIIGIALQGSMIFVWLPEGKKYGQRNDKFRALQTVANQKVAEASAATALEPLDKFCQYATAANRKTWIAKNVAKKCGVLFDDFECIDEGVLMGKVSPEVIEQMRKCN